MKKDILLMRMVFGLLFISSFSLILAIFTDYSAGAVGSLPGYIGAGLFWLCLIAGYVVFGVIAKHRKSRESSMGTQGSPRWKSLNPGIISFFSNKYAMIADVIMVISFILTMVFMFIPSINQNVTVVLIAVLIYSVHMHSILNGVNFRYIKMLTAKGE